MPKAKGPYLTTRPDSPNWFIRATVDGRQVFRSTHTSDREAAEALLTQYKARLLKELVHGKVATTTFREAAEGYIKAGGQKQFLFRERVKGGGDTGLIPYFDDALLADITQDDLDTAARKLCKPGAGRETLIRNVYTPFIAVWNFASVESRKWAAPKKWERPRKPKGTGNRPTSDRAGTTPVSYDRAWEFVSAMSPAPALLMTFLFYTGMRPIEAFALECGDLDIDSRWMAVRSSKTGEPRGVPMHEMLVPMLTTLKARGGNDERPAVFLDRHGQTYRITDNENGINGQLKGAIKGARGRLQKAKRAIDDVSPYTARHTVSTMLVINGVHPHVKDQILGHAADDMSRHYTNVPQRPLIEAINTLPIIDAWANAEWMMEPLTWQSRLTRWENYGRAGTPSPEPGV